MTLDLTQKEALSNFLAGKCIALLGGAGCGKSFAMQEMLKQARMLQDGFPVVAACALSNQTATQIDGHTVHALFGAPPHWRFSKSELWNIVIRQPTKLEALRRIEILFIDEIIVLTSIVLDCIDYVLHKLARTDELGSIPFGGRQVVIEGDPFQLQAIPQPRCENDENSPPDPNNSKTLWKEDLPAYNSRSWFLTFGGYGSGVIVYLDTNHRQAQDEQFFSLLNRVRMAVNTPMDIEKLNSTSWGHRLPPPTHTELCLYKNTVVRKNYQTLRSMPGVMHSSCAVDSFYDTNPLSCQKLLDNAAPRKIYMKRGCEVLINVSIGDLAPGTRVVVESVYQADGLHAGNSNIGHVVVSKGTSRYEVYPFSFAIRRYDTKVIATRKQLPFIPAYAITIHRSQGLTLHTVAIDFTAVNQWKPEGMVYVALSRCTSFNGLWVRGLSAQHIRVSPQAIRLVEKLVSLHQAYPHRILFSEGNTPAILQRTIR